MQGRRRPQPSGTNSPSSSSSRYLARAARPHGVRSPTGTSKIRFLAVRPPGHARHPRVRGNAAHRSAAMAGGARPDPFRTRKLSRRAPMVLRGKPVGEQGAADRWTAFATRTREGPRGRPRGPSSFLRGGGAHAEHRLFFFFPWPFSSSRRFHGCFPYLLISGYNRVRLLNSDVGRLYG